MLRLALLALLCVSAQAVQIEEYTQEFVVDQSDAYVLPHKISSPEKSFYYMSCMKTANVYEVNCNLTMQWVNGTHKYCDNIKLVEPASREIMLNEMLLKRMGKHKMVFEWYSKDMTNGYPFQYKKVSLINMDQCSHLDLDFPIDKMDWTNHEVVVYHDSFDVYVTSHALCGTYQHCMLHYNYDGQQVGSVMNFATKYTSIYSLPVNYKDSSKGAYFAMVEFMPTGGMMHATHVSSMGVEHELFTVPMKDANSIKYMVGSNKKEHYGFCYYEDPASTSVHCYQYHHGNQVMNTMVDLGAGNRLVAIFNLHNGGMIMVYRGCNGMPECKIAYAKHVDASGHVKKSYEIPNVEYQCHSPSDELVVDHMEYEGMGCYYFACAHKVAMMTNLKFMTKCANIE